MYHGRWSVTFRPRQNTSAEVRRPGTSNFLRGTQRTSFAKADRSLLLRAFRAGIELLNELLERNSMNTRRPAERHEPRGDCEEPSPHVRTTMAAEHFKRRRPSRQNCPNAHARCYWIRHVPRRKVQVRLTDQTLSRAASSACRSNRRILTPEPEARKRRAGAGPRRCVGVRLRPTAGKRIELYPESREEAPAIRAQV